MPLSNAEKQRRHRERLRTQGLVHIQGWVTPAQTKLIKKIIAGEIYAGAQAELMPAGSISARHAGSAPSPRRNPQRPLRMFALTVPGLSPLLSRELEGIDGVTVHDQGFDSRADVVLFDVQAQPQGAALHLDIAEDVFIEVGRTLRSEGDNARWIANRIWRPERVRRALDTYASLTHGVSKRATYRVITRVLQEKLFLRSELRREFVATIQRNHAGWQPADPGHLEIWVVEYRRGCLLAGLRLSDVRMRQHGGRAVERQGALRPVVAAAMVRLAGGARGMLLDPCCGSGTILVEAGRAGWQTYGLDIDAHAVAVAGKNAAGTVVASGDARSLPLADEAVAACVSNLPFGQQYDVQGSMRDWLRRVLAELSRVTWTGGRIVLLASDIPRDVVPAKMRLTERFPIRLLGTRTTIWSSDRT